MIHFDCDYMAGAHPAVLEAIIRNNGVQTPGYGADSFCEKAKALIRRECGVPDADVWFMVGGTQTNSTVLDGLLGRTEGVIAAQTGHINMHESGAIELSGHKVLALPSHDGKLDAAEVEAFIKGFYADETWEHMVAPGAVYISFPTELGTIYSREELTALSAVCRSAGIPLFIDGARLGYGLAASDDLSIKDIAGLADVFTIGGTKMGMLMGEAVVSTTPGRLERFFTLMKARGAVLAKGRLLGMQFGTMFEDGLYYRIGEHGVRLAMRLKGIFEAKGFKTSLDSPTNQQFFILPNEVIDRLLEHTSFEYWGPRGETESEVRFVTSWETTDADLDELENLLK